MAQWKKKKGLRKRRGAAPQARSSDSEDGEFEIQAEDDTRAQKVSAGLGHTLEPEPRLRAAPRGLRFPSWGVGTGEGGERSAGQESGRFAGLSTCLGPVKPRVLTAGANTYQRLGPSGLLGRLLFAPLIGYLLHRGRVLVPFRPMKSMDFEDLSLEFRGFLRG